MSHGISGYHGRVNLYRPLEQLADSEPQVKKAGREAASTPPSKEASLGSDLSEAESRMIQDYFPESEQMKLRLYGPNRQAEAVNPNAVGQRLDLRG